MASPNVEEYVHGALVIVTLIKDRDEASFVIKHGDKASDPKHVSIEHYLKAGLSDRDALNKVLDLVKDVVQSAHVAGLF
ncbi:hypothetical protein EHZ19_28345 [Paraburkholderia bannensis]|uniref:hypothetical protein n=1 Tax=Paraburkholderia sp. SIMBA_027 TaxID=3085770 RepID=UPI000F51ED35|nr:hypothetical protein [Paraburkholderia bannensis]RQM44481.1 hypothetical protein EHZ19_28345 [Paraburkholderia bannensis]